MAAETDETRAATWVGAKDVPLVASRAGLKDQTKAGSLGRMRVGPLVDEKVATTAGSWVDEKVDARAGGTADQTACPLVRQSERGDRKCSPRKKTSVADTQYTQ